MESTVEPEDVDTFTVLACCEDLGEEMVGMVLTSTEGEWEPQADTPNCVESDELNWQAPDFECVAHHKAVFTWSDGGTCEATAITNVEEENGNGNGNGNGDEE